MNGDDDDYNSTSKLAIGFLTKPDGSRWVYADLLKYGPPCPQLVVALHDLFRIIQAMAICEDEKYPPPLRGRSMLEDFFKDAVRARNETMWPELARKYKIPIRRGDVVVKTNGARLGAHASEPLLKRELTADDIFGRR